MDQICLDVDLLHNGTYKSRLIIKECKNYSEQFLAHFTQVNKLALNS